MKFFFPFEKRSFLVIEAEKENLKNLKNDLKTRLEICETRYFFWSIREEIWFNVKINEEFV